MLTFDPETTFSPVDVASDFADRFFFIVSIGLVAGVVEATGTVDVVTIGQIPPVFRTVSF